MAQSRRPRKPRDYKAEYARRIRNARAKARAEGQPFERKQARGHTREREEKQARRARVKATYGVTPERLARLRREAQAAIESQLAARGTKGTVDATEIRRNLAAIPSNQAAAMLAVIARLSGDDIKRYAAMTYDEVILHFPELANDQERNPLWYGSKNASYFARAA